MALQFSVKEAFNRAFGRKGKDIIADTSAHTGNWTHLIALDDCVFASLTDSTIKSGTMAGVTLYAGHTYEGDITAFQLSSGKLRAERL